VQKPSLSQYLMVLTNREGHAIAEKDISRLKLFGFYKNSGKKQISENVRSWVKSDCQAYLQASYQSNAYREDGNWLKLTLANQGGLSASARAG